MSGPRALTSATPDEPPGGAMAVQPRDPVAALPRERTSFIGRHDEIAALTTALGRSRLVTLVGPGGVGKTRLALRTVRRSAGGASSGAAHPLALGGERSARRDRQGGATAGARGPLAEADPADAEEVVLVELSGLRAPELLAETVAERLGLPQSENRSALEAVLDALSVGRHLVILDTCEHLADACGAFADVLLCETDDTRVLATSRIPLHAPGEVVMPLDPLPIESPHGGDAVELFDQRAAEAVAGFSVDAGNRADVVRLCTRLDGIPLALELAAVRLRAFPLDVLVARLEHCFTLLTANRASRFERHRTLRLAIEWSHDLCTQQQRLLWQRLSVFAGGFDIEAVESVCVGGELAAEEVLETLGELVEQSVVRRADDEWGLRYRMLDTIREFGRERLEGAGEEEVKTAGDRHLEWFTARAREYGEQIFDSDQVRLTQLLRRDHDNLRVAFGYAIDSGMRERASALARGLSMYFGILGAYAEGIGWERRLQALYPESCLERAWSLFSVCHQAVFQGALEDSMQAGMEAAKIAKDLGEGRLESMSRTFAAGAMNFSGDREAAYEEMSRAAELADRYGDRMTKVFLHACRGYLLMFLGRGDEAVDDCHTALALIAEAPRADGERWWRSYAYLTIGVARFLQGRGEQSGEAARTAVRLTHDIGNPLGTAYGLEVLAWLAAGQQRHKRAAWLLGAADPLWRKTGRRVSNQQVWEDHHQHAAAAAREALGAARFEELWRTGASRPLARVIDAAEADVDTIGRTGSYPAPDGTGTARDRDLTQLTRRESEVAQMAADGLSNREIAGALYLSRRTVDAHMERILRKLAVTSRTLIKGRLAEQQSVAAKDDPQDGSKG